MNPFQCYNFVDFVSHAVRVMYSLYALLYMHECVWYSVHCAHIKLAYSQIYTNDDDGAHIALSVQVSASQNTCVCVLAASAAAAEFTFPTCLLGCRNVCPILQRIHAVSIMRHLYPRHPHPPITSPHHNVEFHQLGYAAAYQWSVVVGCGL